MIEFASKQYAIRTAVIGPKGMSQNVLVWDIETVPDFVRFAMANDLIGKSDDEIRHRQVR